MVIARGNKRNTLYITKNPSNVVVAEANNDAKPRHNKLGHMSQKEMKRLLSKEKLPELKTINFDMYELCSKEAKEA